MPLSEARINANRQNCKKSTGPKTAEGKNRSRGNAVKHGLCSKVLVTEDADALLARTEEIAQTLPVAAAGLDRWAAGQVALQSVRIERCQSIENAVRGRVMSRAEVTWDEDRRLEAILLGDTISKNPEVVSARLRETVHGCEWLIARWAMLARAADSQKGWTPEQTGLAFDLLGAPRAFRETAPPGTDVDLEGRVISQPESQAALARQRITTLVERRDLLGPLNEAERLRAAADLSDDTDPELCRLRRYETALHHRMRWSYDLLLRLASQQPKDTAGEAPPGSEQPTAAEADSVTAPESNPVVNAMKVGVTASIPPGRPISRAERRLNKAESRREARKRKREKCRA